MKKMVGIMLLLCSIMPFMACTSTEDEPYKSETEQPSDDPNNNEEEDNDTTPVYGHLTTANTVSDVVNHEAFNGFGLGIGTSAEGWEKDAVAFWEKYISRKNGKSNRK